MNSEVAINTADLLGGEGKFLPVKVLLEEVSFLFQDKIINH
jgi:hypothetical protein